MSRPRKTPLPYLCGKFIPLSRTFCERDENHPGKCLGLALQPYGTAKEAAKAEDEARR